MLGELAGFFIRIKFPKKYLIGTKSKPKWRGHIRKAPFSPFFSNILVSEYKLFRFIKSIIIPISLQSTTSYVSSHAYKNIHTGHITQIFNTYIRNFIFILHFPSYMMILYRKSLLICYIQLNRFLYRYNNFT